MIVTVQYPVKAERSCGLAGAIRANAVRRALHTVGIDIVAQAFKDSALAFVYEIPLQPLDSMLDGFCAAFFKNGIVCEIGVGTVLDKRFREAGRFAACDPFGDEDDEPTP